MGIFESTPEITTTPIESGRPPQQRPRPKPKLTQAQQLEAAEKTINELMQQVVSFLTIHPVFTLQEAQIARKNANRLNEGLLQQQLILDGITEENLRARRSELTRHLQPQMDEIEEIMKELDEKINSLQQKERSDVASETIPEAKPSDKHQELNKKISSDVGGTTIPGVEPSDKHQELEQMEHSDVAGAIISQTNPDDKHQELDEQQKESSGIAGTTISKAEASDEHQELGEKINSDVAGTTIPEGKLCVEHQAEGNEVIDKQILKNSFQ